MLTCRGPESVPRAGSVSAPGGWGEPGHGAGLDGGGILEGPDGGWSFRNSAGMCGVVTERQPFPVTPSCVLKRNWMHFEGSTKEEAAGRQWRRLQSRICKLRWVPLKDNIHSCELYREQTLQQCYVVGLRLFPCIYDSSSVQLISDMRPFWNLSEVYLPGGEFKNP